MIPTLSPMLQQIHQNRDRLILELERRKAFRLTIAIFLALSVAAMCWILAP